MPTTTERRGFALPTAILVIAVMTIMIAGGFSLVSAERRSVSDQRAQITAFKLAEDGLELFLIRRDSLLPAAGKIPGPKDSVRIYFTGGYADVSLTRIRPVIGTMSGLYVVRSRGVETVGTYAGTPEGVRTVAQYVLFEPAPMQVLAGWTALSGLDKNGKAGTLGGFDQCAEADDVAGVAVPLEPGFMGKTDAAEGDPPIKTVVYDSVAIDWDAIINQDAIEPSITIPGGSFPSTTQFANPDYYPIIRINLADYTLPNSGQGMIISEGNITINGSSQWKGVLLIGGNLTSHGSNGVFGATVSGLNVLLGMEVPPSEADGTKTYMYNSCEVTKANRSAGSLVTLKNTWVDNWVEY